jgi:sugar lactone lactonase YvrE
MARRTKAALAIITVAAVMLLAGCSLAGPQIATPTTRTLQQYSTANRLDFLARRERDRALVWRSNPGPGWISPALPQHIVYVSDEPGQTVYIFPQLGQNQPPVGAITSGVAAPNGLFVDAHGNLYVCNFGGGTVTVYHRGAITPYRTLTGAGSAIDVVVGLDGSVYVSDWDSGTSGRIVEYAPRHTSPSHIIDVNGGPEGIALDKNNDLFVAYNDITSNDGEVLEFAPGSTTGTNLGIHIGNAGGATIDSNQNLLVVDQNIPGVDVFPPGQTKPSEQITGFSLAFDIALTASDDRLWITQPFTAVNEVRYPSGKHIDSITNTITTAFGVATSPHGSY